MLVGFQIGIFILGLAALLWGATKLIDSSVYLAKKANISPLIIGITILSIGTSLPEIATSIASFTAGHADIAMGNIVGSELVQITLILGLVALIRPLKEKRKEILFYGISMIVAVLLTLLVVSNNTVQWYEGLFLVMAYITYLIYAVTRDKHKYIHKHKKEHEKEIHWVKTTSMIILGVALVIAGSKFMIESSVEISRYFGVSEYIIAVFVIGLGTSLPELVVSGIAAWKKQFDMGVGNLLGSNITDPTLSFGIGALFVKSATITPVASYSIIILGIIFIIVIGLFAIRKKITRIEAAFLIMLYIISMFFI